MKRFAQMMILLIIFSIQNVYAENFSITSKYVILYNLDDNEILYELNSNEKVPIASLTKIMTTIVAIENISDLEQEVVVPKEAFLGIEEYTQMGLKTGDVITYRDLLYGIMLPSGADAANTLAINLSGSIENFVKLMNDKASELKLNNTHFDNPIGMDSENNYSTATDISTLLIYSLKNDTFKEIFTTQNYTISNLNISLKSTLIGYSKSYGLDVSEILGAKSGFTDDAGLCLASIASIDDVNFLLITMGADTSSRFNAVKDSLEIYHYYSSNYSYQTILKKGQLLKTLSVKWGKIQTYEVTADENISLYLENNIHKNNLEYIYNGIEEITYQNKKGDKIGTVTVKYDDHDLLVYDVYLTKKLEFYHPILYSVILLSFIIMLLSLFRIVRLKKEKKT